MYRGTRGIRGVKGSHDAAGEVPVTPPWRARSLTLSLVQAATGAGSYDGEGPMRLIRHERVSEDGHQRGR